MARDFFGMNDEEMDAAMTLGRQKVDNVHTLGFFGMGLKAASFSQANAFQVLSRARGEAPQGRRMTSEDIVTAVKDIIASIAPDEDLSNLTLDEKLREQIELDSMDFLDIVMELRKRYGVQVPEEDYPELASLRGCADYLGPKLAGKELVLTSNA